MTSKRFKEEAAFLDGPRGRLLELKYLWTVCVQFLKGFRALHFIGPCITVFGSARFHEGHAYYHWARQVSAALSKLGFTIMTGGGPGIMEAANRGAKEAGGLSIGCNIVLPKEQHPNPYLDKFVNIESFFIRKELLRKYSFAFVVMPGGFGTLDEMFETITLIQTKKMQHFPVVVMGLEYHIGLINHIHIMIEKGAISQEDSQLILFTDDVTEAIQHIEKVIKTYRSKRLSKKQKPKWFLGENKVRKK